jgi:hypothetical protein
MLIQINIWGAKYYKNKNIKAKSYKIIDLLSIDKTLY